MSDAITGWKLDAASRAALLARFPPRYARTVADHVTHGRKREAPPLPSVSSAEVIGHSDDGAGVEALVVAIGGSSERWDGSRYHLTWSLAEGREAKESNDVIARCGWREVEGCPAAELTPAEWR